MKKISLFIIILFFVNMAFSQDRIPLIGEKAPSFTANSTNGKIDFPKDFGNSWKILFSHPRDFTPVCTSEVLQLAEMQKEFDALGVKIAIISTDELSQHEGWKKAIEAIKLDDNKSVTINFPLIEDKNAKISRKYGMLHEPTSTTKDVRGVFIISPDNIIESINFYPMNVGRNMNEVVRIVEALQTAQANKVLIPVDWQKGGDVLMPYKPYTDQDLAKNPNLKNEYYNVGNDMWYKKVSDK